MATSHLNVINLQVQAEDQIAIDKANGTYEANLAANEKYYLWQSDFQTLPLGMYGDPELYAQRLRDALPEVTTLRLPFNLNSFNADGSLHPQYEQFLDAAARQGFTLIMAQAEGDAQNLTAQGPDALDQMRDALTGPVYDRMEQAWTTMLDWMDAHPAVKDAVYGYEVVNEPASYNQATFYADTRDAGLQEFVSLYARHMVDLGQMIEDRADGARILVGGWTYSERFQTLADIPMGEGSALDYIRAALGDSLVWSAHLYPGWLGTEGLSDPDDVRTALDRIYAPILGDDMILTETNAQGNEAYNLISDRPEVQGFVQAYDWFADHGVGVGWFTGSQYGVSNLSRMDPDGTLRFVQQASYGAAMDAFSLGGEDPAQAGGEVVAIQMIHARLRNQITDPDYEAINEFDIAQFLGLALGHGGNDTLNGSADANNFLYGGSGADRVRGNVLDDFLYGQDGDDVVDGGASGHDHLLGGRGADRLISGGGITQMYGGAGGDLFVAHPRGRSILVDFDPGAGDRLIVNEAGFSAQDLADRAQSIDWDGSGPRDLRIGLPGGGEITMLGMGERLDEVIAALLPAEGNVDPVPPFSENEVLRGRPGIDILHGGAGNDTIYGDPDGESGADQLYGEDGHDVLYGRGDADLLDGGDGRDVLSGGNGNDLLYGGEKNDQLDGDDDNDRLYGDTGNDLLRGGRGDDSLWGGGGQDVIEGGDGFDLLHGDGGDDQISGGNGNDTLFGSTGNDILRGEQSNDLLWGEKWHDTLYGGGGQDQLFGGSENDVLYGEDANDQLYGESGNDLLDGGDQSDLLDGGSGNDTLTGGVGNDTLFGQQGDDLLNGGGMYDTIHGGAGNDTLLGEAGLDWLEGGQGQDVATGGGSADSFVFALGDGGLRITDFSIGQGDILRLDAALLDGSTSIADLQERAIVTEAGTSILFAGGDLIVMSNFRTALSDSFVDIL